MVLREGEAEVKESGTKAAKPSAAARRISLKAKSRVKASEKDKKQNSDTDDGDLTAIEKEAEQLALDETLSRLGIQQ